jgi:hypothetical protein
MARTLGVNQIINKQYETFEFCGEWADTFGHPSKNFQMLVYGKPKNGKTSFMMQFAKYLAINHGKVFYNSVEEGDSKTIKDALERCNMTDVPDGRFMLGDRYFYRQLVEKLQMRNSGRFVFIDSRDYMQLTSHQYKKLREHFPNKCIIIICWESAGKPEGKYAKDIEYMVDIVCHVRDYKARVRSRFGGGQEFVIWNRKPKAGEQIKLKIA